MGSGNSPAAAQRGVSCIPRGPIRLGRFEIEISYCRRLCHNRAIRYDRTNCADPMKPPRRRITIPLDGFSPPTIQWYRAGYHVEVGDRKIFVYERGTGPALLFLHGFPTSCYDWRAVMQRLALNGRRVAFDFLGFGLSDKPEAFSYSLFDQADLVEALAKELKIDAAHVISHDMGTSVHCELLARQNEGRLGFRIKSSSLLNGSMLQWLAQITPFQQMLASNDRLDEAIELCRGDFEPIYVPALRSLMQQPETLSDEDAVVMNELMRYQHGAHRIPAIGGYMRERYVHRDRWLGALEKSDTPVQFIWATGDPIATAAMGRELAQRVPNARFTELEGVGHFLMFENPEAVAGEIQKLVCPGCTDEDAASTADNPIGIGSKANEAETEIKLSSADRDFTGRAAEPETTEGEPGASTTAADLSDDVVDESPSLGTASATEIPTHGVVVDVSSATAPPPDQPAPHIASDAPATRETNSLESLMRRPVADASDHSGEQLTSSTEPGQPLDSTTE